MLTLAAWVHRLDPVAIPLGPVAVRWYGLSYLFGFLIAYYIIRRVTRVGVSTVKPDHVGDLIVWLAMGVVIGGRVGYCLFYRPDLFITFHGSLPYWGVLAINEGGMASHGGMIGGIVASWLYARRNQHSWPFILDLFAFGAPLGLFFGRIANFVNGELYGRPCNPDLPWAVKFPQEMYHWSAADIELLAKQMSASKGLLRGGTGDFHPISSVTDMIAALQRGDGIVAMYLSKNLTSRHPSQLYEAILEGLVLFAVLAWVWRKPRKPLVIGSLFCIVYGAVRIVAEFFREPDFHLLNEEFARFHVTRGQWLSLLLMIAGMILLSIFTRRDVPKMGGWRKFTLPGAV